MDVDDDDDEKMKTNINLIETQKKKTPMFLMPLANLCGAYGNLHAHKTHVPLHSKYSYPP